MPTRFVWIGRVVERGTLRLCSQWILRRLHDLQFLASRRRSNAPLSFWSLPSTTASRSTVRGPCLERLGRDVTVNVIERRGRWASGQGSEATPGARPRRGASRRGLVIGVRSSIRRWSKGSRNRWGRWVNWFPDDLGRRGRRRLAVRLQAFAAGSDVARAWGHSPQKFPCCPRRRSLGLSAGARGQQYRANGCSPLGDSRREARSTWWSSDWRLGTGWRATSLRDYCRGEALKTEEFAGRPTAARSRSIHHTPMAATPAKPSATSAASAVPSACSRPRTGVPISPAGSRRRTDPVSRTRSWRIVETPLQDQTAVGDRGKKRVLTGTQSIG